MVFLTNFFSKLSVFNKKVGKIFAETKIMRTFASLSKNKALLKKEFWRGGRVVDCGGLENRCTARYPGFESLSLRFLKNSLLI